MRNFSLDYEVLSNEIDKKVYKYTDVKDKLVKVAFDIVKFNDDPYEKLWQVQSTNDGECIVALYSEDGNNDVVEVKTAAHTKNNWDVSVNERMKNIDVFYKNEPVLRIQASVLGIPLNELALVKKYLPEKLATNKNLVAALLNELHINDRQEFLKKYPELSI